MLPTHGTIKAMTQPPAYPTQPGFGGAPPQSFQCPKCPGTMQTYNRNGVHIEQCTSCRGIFLDFGEFEHLVRMEGQYSQPMPPPQAHGSYGPAWGSYGSHHYHKKGIGGLFFSS